MSINFLLEQTELFARLILAAICGFAIGFERKNRRKEAGVRTHVIVALASCLMMEISKYGFFDLGKFDGARIAAQVVSGIGFLGAGMIFVHKNSIKGLTTAAGVWATSGIGMAVGAGMYIIGVMTTVTILIIQVVFHKHRVFLSHSSTEDVSFIVDDCPEAIEFVKNYIYERDMAIETVSLIKLENDLLRIEVVAAFHDEIDMYEFAVKAYENPMVKSVINDVAK